MKHQEAPIFLYIALLLLGHSCSSAGSNSCLRNVDWGMSREEVVIAEARQPDTTWFMGDIAGMAIRDVIICGFTADLIYGFVRDTLVFADYYIEMDSGSAEKSVKDFKELNLKLIEAIGRPTLDTIIDKRAKPITNTVDALFSSEYHLNTVWINSVTSCNHSLQGGNGWMFHRVTFNSQKHEYLVDELMAHLQMVAASPPQDEILPGIKWGSSPLDLLSLYGESRLIKGYHSDSLYCMAFDADLYGLDAIHLHYFVDSGLIESNLWGVEEHADVERHLIDYQLVRYRLIEQWGEPTSSNYDVKTANIESIINGNALQDAWIGVGIEITHELSPSEEGSLDHFVFFSSSGYRRVLKDIQYQLRK